MRGWSRRKRIAFSFKMWSTCLSLMIDCFLSILMARRCGTRVRSFSGTALDGKYFALRTLPKEPARKRKGEAPEKESLRLQRTPRNAALPSDGRVRPATPAPLTTRCGVCTHEQTRKRGRVDQNKLLRSCKGSRGCKARLPRRSLRRSSSSLFPPRTLAWPFLFGGNARKKSVCWTGSDAPVPKVGPNSKASFEVPRGTRGLLIFPKFHSKFPTPDASALPAALSLSRCFSLREHGARAPPRRNRKLETCDPKRPPAEPWRCEEEAGEDVRMSTADAQWTLRSSRRQRVAHSQGAASV